jgi:hypothetical protein
MRRRGSQIIGAVTLPAVKVLRNVRRSCSTTPEHLFQPCQRVAADDEKAAARRVIQRMTIKDSQLESDATGSRRKKPYPHVSSDFNDQRLTVS